MTQARGATAAYPLLLGLGALDATGYSVIVPVAPAIADAIERAREPFDVNSLAQVAAIAALGAEMAHLAEMLAALGEVGAARSHLGDASVAAALEELLGNWTRTRRVLVTSLAELGAAAETAGAAYLRVEAAVGDSLGGPSR